MIGADACRVILGLTMVFSEGFYHGWLDCLLRTARRFQGAAPWGQLTHLPCHLKAMQLRLDKYPKDSERDAKHAESIGRAPLSSSMSSVLL